MGLVGAVLVSGAQLAGHWDKTHVSSQAGLVAGDAGKGRQEVSWAQGLCPRWCLCMELHGLLVFGITLSSGWLSAGLTPVVCAGPGLSCSLGALC